MKKRSIFVIGDSVSIHYGPYLKEMLKNKFNYDRKRGLDDALINLDRPIGANAGDSKMILDYLIEEETKGINYDILIINSGLHDIRTERNTGSKQINEDEYEFNLNKIIDIAKRISNKVIWITTTPIIDEIHNSRKGGFLRYSEDLEVYNMIAKTVMENKDVEIIDLYSFTKDLGKDIYCDHVHFTNEVRRLQSVFITGYLSNNV
ncbi:MAG: SGNH/GDSL hydrolase family protein [Sarcina sp.]